MRPLRVLHLASFSGNIGDNFNHMGFRPWFESMVGRPIIWSNLEIREFYWKERTWDSSLVELANRHDLLVVGGGNYFELWVENSATGASFALPSELMRKIETPVFFNSLGLDVGQGTGKANVQRFRNFLDVVLAEPRVLVSLRNDGSLSTARKYLGDHYASQMHLLPDGGFFAGDQLAGTPEAEHPLLAVNLACDMPEIRFKTSAGVEDRAEFAQQTAFALTGLCRTLPELRIVFIPHVYHDLEIISEAVKYLPDRMRRTRIEVAPFGSGDIAARECLKIYGAASAVLGMRFHANVGAISLGRQTIGLASYPQISLLYDEIGQPDRLVQTGNSDYRSRLESLLVMAIAEPQTFMHGPDEAVSLVGSQRSAFEKVLRRWLEATRIR